MFPSWCLIFSYQFFKLELAVVWHAYLAGGQGLYKLAQADPKQGTWEQATKFL